MLTKRQLQAGAVLKNHLASILPQFIQWAPHLASMRFIISEIRVSADLRKALVFISSGFQGALQENFDPTALIHYLKESAPQIQKKLAPLITFKYVPLLKFTFDDRLDRQEEFQVLLRNIASDSSDHST